ncbi:hypothetical protein RJ639_027109 [Escallonia herrerae]|uniref:CCHC-type domain-containing protein n=1 Tax=Escallonia herrerae TaxID=1293975 RepID=A0AA89BQ26_9ASTE|nr:hypothetical protein RJ639_027109 [Escallonia herrerae]
MNASEWAILDRKALATVRLSLTPQVAFNISKKKTTAAVMKALEKFWNNLVTTVSNSTISGTLTLNDVVSSVMNDEMRRKTIGDGISSTTTLSVESRGRQNNKQNNRGRSPTSGRSRGKSKSKGKTIVCWNCNMEGHKKNDCTELKKKKGAGEDKVMMKGQIWDCFCDYVHGDYGHVTVGNGYRCSIVGKGKVEIKLSNGGTLVLKDIRHIPELQKNLISISGLDREGYFVAFGEKQWKSAIHLAKNSTFHSRTKHIQLRYHFIRSLLEDGQLNLEKIEGNKNPADMLMKVVDRKKLSLCSTLISLR